MKTPNLGADFGNTARKRKGGHCKEDGQNIDELVVNASHSHKTSSPTVLHTVHAQCQSPLTQQNPPQVSKMPINHTLKAPHHITKAYPMSDIWLEVSILGKDDESDAN